jgi:hypothetical protein
LAAHIGKFAMTLGALLVSGQLFAHSHGHQMTEAEQKAANGVFEDKDVKDRNCLTGTAPGSRSIRSCWTVRWIRSLNRKREG